MMASIPRERGASNHGLQESSDIEYRAEFTAGVTSCHKEQPCGYKTNFCYFMYNVDHHIHDGNQTKWTAVLEPKW